MLTDVDLSARHFYSLRVEDAAEDFLVLAEDSELIFLSDATIETVLGAFEGSGRDSLRKRAESTALADV